MSDSEYWIIKLDLEHDLPETDFYSRMEKHLPQLEKSEIKYEVEFGSIRNIDWGTAIMMNSEGESTLCKCGKPAEQVIIGSEAFLATCQECTLYVKFSNKVWCGKNFGEENGESVE